MQHVLDVWGAWCSVQHILEEAPIPSGPCTGLHGRLGRPVLLRNRNDDDLEVQSAQIVACNLLALKEAEVFRAQPFTDQVSWSELED